MGAEVRTGTFEGFDWIYEVDKLKKIDARNRGTGYYSGSVALCDFKYAGDLSDYTEDKMDDYINNTMLKIEKLRGIVFVQKRLGFIYIKPVYEKIKKNSSLQVKLSVYRDSYLTRRKSDSSLSVQMCIDGEGMVHCMDSDNCLDNLIERTNKELRNGNYRKDLYVLSKDICLYFYGNGILSDKKIQNTDGTDVFPYNEYRWIAVVPT